MIDPREFQRLLDENTDRLRQLEDNPKHATAPKTDMALDVSASMKNHEATANPQDGVSVFDRHWRTGFCVPPQFRGSSERPWGPWGEPTKPEEADEEADNKELDNLSNGE